MRGQSLNLQNSFSLEVNNFSLEKTFNCGQTFRFFKEGNTYYYPYNDTLLEIKEVPLKNNVRLDVKAICKEMSKDEFENIFGISHHIKSINQRIIEIAPQMEEAVLFSNGIRLIKMPVFETTVSFLFSIQSQIPVIQARLNKLAMLGKRSVTVSGSKFYLFPHREDLLKFSYEDIASLHLGFREKFFINFIKNYTEDDLEALRDASYEEKKQFLMSILGIGEKVSECIILFGYGDLSAFPVDTWIIRGMKHFFGINGTTKKLTEFGRKTFGEVSGYAQQYIYYYMRLLS